MPIQPCVYCNTLRIFHCYCNTKYRYRQEYGTGMAGSVGGGVGLPHTAYR